MFSCPTCPVGFSLPRLSISGDDLCGLLLAGLLHTSNFSFLLPLTTARCWRSRLDSYIYDYLVKRNLQNTAKAFQAESNVSSGPVGECYTMCCDRVLMMAPFLASGLVGSYLSA